VPARWPAMSSKLLRLAALVAALSAPALTVHAQGLPIEGTWKAPTKHAVVELHRCGEMLCGRILSSDRLKREPDLRDYKNPRQDLQGRRVKGLDFVTGFHGGPDTWTDGEIYNPDDGHTYHGTIKLIAPDQVRLNGCVFFPLCQSQTWARAK
jgi:uncharacterized protein (DUF2147 family)